MADITKDDVIEFIANMSVLELSELAHEARGEVVVDRPQIEQVVLDGRTGEGQAGPCLQPSKLLGGLGGRGLDGLRLVQDEVVEALLGEVRGVLTERPRLRQWISLPSPAHGCWTSRPNSGTAPKTRVHSFG